MKIKNSKRIRNSLLASKIILLLLLNFISLQVNAQKPDSLGIIDPLDCSDPYLNGKNEYLKNYMEKYGFPDSNITSTVKVYIEFYVDSTGAVLNPKIKRGYNQKFNQVAMDIVKNMPQWVPAICNGIPKKTRLILPITFRLQ